LLFSDICGHIEHSAVLVKTHNPKRRNKTAVKLAGCLKTATLFFLVSDNLKIKT